MRCAGKHTCGWTVVVTDQDDQFDDPQDGVSVCGTAAEKAARHEAICSHANNTDFEVRG